MQAATIVFPHQLFKHHPAIEKGSTVYLVEEWLFFKQYAFHKQKLVLHRASMQFYKTYLEQKGCTVEYIACTNPLSHCKKLLQHLHGNSTTSIRIAYVADDWLEKRINQASDKYGLALEWFHSPNFLNTKESLQNYFDHKKSYFQTDFYIHQRKQKQILVEANNQPVGGKWTFDADNREKIPKHTIIPNCEWSLCNKFVIEAKDYVQQQFPANNGHLHFTTNKKEGKHFYPTTFDEAENWLQQFLKQRFHLFGNYEDAMLSSEHFLYHSVLTPMLNIGLLTPKQVIDAALDFAATNNIPINSLEGFIRQIIGWREFIHIVYCREGVKQRTTNYWGFKRKIPTSFYTGNTGIEPIDIVIKKLLNTAYNHHIERLMLLGNFMLLCEFDPNEVYRWFMEMYIDSYDWVMVPNIYGMTQFADGGLMTTKPYISGSNYILKMSNYNKSKSNKGWNAIWDALFWRFMHVHRSFFLTNPRLGMLIKSFDKMAKEKQEQHLQLAENFLQQLDQSLIDEKTLEQGKPTSLFY